MTDLILNGWEYLTKINPLNIDSTQELQQIYLQKYNESYKLFIDSLCLSVDKLGEIKEINSLVIDSVSREKKTNYKFIIDLNGENDIINTNDEYDYKFLKSKFINFKNKKIKQDLINYYKPLGFYVKGPLFLLKDKYCIELYWN